MKTLSLRLLLIFLAVAVCAEAMATTISGKLSYAGTATGTIVVAAFSNQQFNGNPSAWIQLYSPGSYTISGLADGTYYMVSVIYTRGMENSLQKTDPWGVYGTWGNLTPVNISGGKGVSGVDITLVDGTEEHPNPFYKEEELYSADAHSKSWNYGKNYQVQFAVEDSDHKATSVEVTGPGITGFLRLDYDNNEKDWNSWHTNKNLDFGSSPPTPPLTYTFTIADPSTKTVKTDIVESFVKCATNLSPSKGEMVTDPISFSWTGVGPGFTYSVQLSDANWNRIWDSDEHLAMTSVSYNGRALTPRAEYFYDVIVEDEYGNASFAKESFVYQTAGQALTHWSINPNVNNAICTAAGNQQRPTLCSDGAGGAIITWQDGRSGYSDIYTQRINALGVVQWAADGVAICTAAGDQAKPTLCSDGAGGAIITWYDGSGTTYGNVLIYAQRVNASGVVQWTANGVAIGIASWYHQEGPPVCSDGSGGAIITWQGNYNVIYAQRIAASGAVQWTTNGVVTVNSDLAAMQDFRIVSDGAGGAIINYRSGGGGIYAQRINASGAVQWTADGVVISTAPNNNNEIPTIVSDGSGGAIITWSDDRSGISYDIYAQRINASGVVQWAANGVTISTAANHQRSPTIACDGAGGAIITWEDFRSGVSDIYAQRINASGAVQWTANGVAISTAPNDQAVPAVVSDGAGGAIINYRSGNGDIYAQRINASGVVQWTANGVAISTASQTYNFTITSDGAGGAIITWDDNHRSGNYDIYAQQVGVGGMLGVVTGVNEGDHSLPTTSILEQNYPNPFNPTTTISFSLPKRSLVSLKVFDLLGREVATIVSEQLSAGNHSRQWNASNVPSGIYFYRLSVVPSAQRDLVPTEGRNGQAGDASTGSARGFVETKKMTLLR